MFLRTEGIIAAAGFSAVTPFLTQWNTANTSAGSSNSNQIKLPLMDSGTYNFIVTWGDGNSSYITAYNQAAVTHTYSSAGSYPVSIQGTCKGFRFAGDGDLLKITNISQWGCIELLSNGSFYQCANLTLTATDVPLLASGNALQSLFLNCSSITGTVNISAWPTSAITDASYMFYTCSGLTGIVMGCDFSACIHMNSMFFYCDALTTASLSGISTPVLSRTDGMFMSSAETSLTIDASALDVQNITDATQMFHARTLPTANYDALLIAWAGQAPLQPGVVFGAGFSKYSAGTATTAHDLLTGTYSWDISDGGQV